PDRRRHRQQVIWSCPVATMTAFPVRSFLAFFKNHGLLNLRGRPRWRTVSGGSRNYVAALAGPLQGKLRQDCAVTGVRRGAGGVFVTDASGEDRAYDAAVFATHAPDAARLLSDPDDDERSVVGAFKTQDNLAILHSDPALMPKRRAAWAAWSYCAAGAPGDRRVSVSYWMNALQGISEQRPLFVSLNPLKEPQADLVHSRHAFAHPVFDQSAIAAQKRLPDIQGRNGIWWCGAWTGFGFHEDGARSGVAAAHALGGKLPWETGAAAAAAYPDRAAAAPSE
ncbi:MAG: FAD-dependent oxidoreductase, partial [Pseudomonadota bacterium]